MPGAEKKLASDAPPLAQGASRRLGYPSRAAPDDDAQDTLFPGDHAGGDAVLQHPEVSDHALTDLPIYAGPSDDLSVGVGLIAPPYLLLSDIHYLAPSGVVPNR